VLEDLLEAPGPHEKLAILRDYLTGLALRAPRSHPSAHRAIALMQEADGDICVEAIAERCGVTSRTLRNVLLSETGLSPKHIARIVRVRRALQLLRGEGAAPRSAGDNFADQAHMCREFRTLLGATPGHISRKMDARQEVPKYRTERDLVDTGLLIVGRRE
jgi:transcriptional regulator GlxA family with amidase domain